MPIAPETQAGAVRRNWRAALCLAAVAAAALTLAYAAPGAPGADGIGAALALGLAGYAVTRLATVSPENGSILDRQVRTWGALALWGVPAVSVVVLAVLIAGLALSPPADLHAQAWTALWTVLGGSGGELLKRGIYDPRTAADLLMHGWLPGVMAQLAVGWCLVVVLMQGAGLRRWIAAVAGLATLASLALDAGLRLEGLHLQAFYLAPPRAWPFMLGAIAALVAPGWRAGPGVASRALDALARLGEFALPFYMWVWPLLAFPRLVLARPLSVAETLAALLGAALLAWATGRWIEAPLRRRLAGRPVAALVAAGAALAVAGLAAAALYASEGLPGRGGAGKGEAPARPPLQAACHTEGETPPPADRCTVPADAAAEVVLWGNSHADHLSPAVLDWAGARGLGVRQATRSGCLPFLRPRARLANPGCIRFNRAAVDEWAEAPPRVILLGAAWTLLMEWTPGDDEAELEAMVDELTWTVRTLREELGPETLIVLLGTTPDHAFAPERCRDRRRFLGLDAARCDRAEPDNGVMAGAVDARLARIAASEPGVALYRPWDALCEGDLCNTRGEGGAWYADASHLTAAGGAIQTRALARVLDARLTGGR